MEELAGQQPQNSKVPKQLQPYQYRKGQSGNPSGRPPGRSLKEYAKEMLNRMTDEEREEFMEGLSKDTIWEMAEGKPMSNSDITSGGQPINVVITKYGDKPAV